MTRRATGADGPASEGALPWRWRLRWIVANRTPPLYDPELADMIERVRPYTLTTPPRLIALRDSVRYIVRHAVEGAVVECGVWRGGSMMAAAIELRRLGDTSRDLHLFDTFAGPPPETPEDAPPPYLSHSRLRAGLRRLARAEPDVPPETPVAEVRHAVESMGYPPERIVLVEGRVEETLPAQAPDRIALLRLDTDLYASTRHELEHLYPRLVPGGVLIVDDYGHFPGARAAVDEYFGSTGQRVLLTQVDYTACVAVKQA
jgi:hypothetical protein